jgi:hypothetical protein
MYHGMNGFAVVPLAVLPFTGLYGIWIVLAGFTLLMALGALWRAMPKPEA